MGPGWEIAGAKALDPFYGLFGTAEAVPLHVVQTGQMGNGLDRGHR
jgi:hypothetical protein